MVRVVIADDEPIALERLELAIIGIPEAELVGKARNGKQALELIEALRPDVAVLDIEMPVLDGLAVANALRAVDAIPEVVFVTAHHDYAIRAFETHAVDYILKPVEFDRFREALRAVITRLRGRAAEQKLGELQALVASLRAGSPDSAARYESDLWVRTRRGLERIPVETIALITADGDYVQLHVGGHRYLHKDTVSSLETKLDPGAFVRVHRSAIVRLEEVAGFQRQGPRKNLITLRSGDKVQVGPSYMDAVVSALRSRRWR